MARSALDCALLLDVLAGADSLDATTVETPVPDYVAELTTPVRGLRVGVPRGYFWDALPADIATAITAALETLGRLGLVIQDVEIPEWSDAVEASKVLIRCEAAAEYRAVLKDRAAELLPEVRERLEAGAATPAPDYVDALRAGTRLRAALRERFRRLDLLALPGRDQTAPRMDPSGKLLEPLSPRNFMSPLNVAGVPALTFPCGFDQQGLPIGLQVVGPAWTEATLLRVAHAFQQATDWHTRRALTFC
jgi:aspartyl-tRNA(Asn)/glutamyl-tRNA(Gln) amidotransferase subunit A